MIHFHQMLQKSASPLAAITRHSKVVGIIDTNCRYGTIDITPIISPRSTANGKPMILNATENIIATNTAISA